MKLKILFVIGIVLAFTQIAWVSTVPIFWLRSTSNWQVSPHEISVDGVVTKMWPCNLVVGTANGLIEIDGEWYSTRVKAKNNWSYIGHLETVRRGVIFWTDDPRIDFTRASRAMIRLQYMCGTWMVTSALGPVDIRVGEK
jgi:hypothetical protein